NIDFSARIAQQAYKGVAEDRIAKMSDMGSFIRIDARVLHQNLAGCNVGGRLLACRQSSSHPGAVNLDIQISRRSDLQLGDAFDGSDLRANHFGDLEWCRTQRLGKGKQRDREVPEFHLRGLFNDNRRQSDSGITLVQTLQHPLGETTFEMTIQGSPLSY